MPFQLGSGGAWKFNNDKIIIIIIDSSVWSLLENKTHSVNDKLWHSL
jgi:hypothetical protein